MESALEFLDQEDTQKNKYLIFTIDTESYGIEIRHVTEIIGVQAITTVPELPDYVRGIINLRGRIVPVMDVRLKFSKPFREYDGRTCIIVVDIDDLQVGLIVDSVSEVMPIQDENIVPAKELKGIQSRYISGVGKTNNQVKLLLDCDRFLSMDEIIQQEEI